jgi:hypothetical protein
MNCFCNAPVRLATTFFLFSQMGGQLGPKCLGGHFFRTKKAFFQRGQTEEAVFVARPVLAIGRGKKSWELGAGKESASIPLRVREG